MTDQARGARDILVLNGGSSSLKCRLVEPDSGAVRAVGLVERIGEAGASATLTAGGETVAWAGSAPDHGAALAAVREMFARLGAPLDSGTLRAVGHRVVHGGTAFRAPTVVTDEVVAAARRLIPLAPLHNPGNVALIEAARAAFGDLPQVAVFDTAFFADLPPAASTYAIDREVAARYGVRRYGFHGISHEYVSRAAAALVRRPVAELGQIVLHLGNGASASAVRGGVAVDTSMGLTPLEGLVMGSRGGDIDPGALIHLMRTAGWGAEELSGLLNHRSGMLGLAGARDMRDVHAAAAAGDADAALALQIYYHRARKYIGAYMAVLGRVDQIVFTAGVGENDAVARAGILAGLDQLGVVLDPARNAAADDGPRIVSTVGSKVAVAVVPTDEELAIARAVAALVP